MKIIGQYAVRSAVFEPKKASEALKKTEEQFGLTLNYASGFDLFVPHFALHYAKRRKTLKCRQAKKTHHRRRFGRAFCGRTYKKA
ncbi:MAG: hypothetical protein L6V93_17565 [Clostridiales bacterium]|nr:MAG: hypothetical protein L6V93_17565 [Clostridiales bacterium]